MRAGLGPTCQWQQPLQQSAGPVWFSPAGSTARGLAGGCGFGLLVLGVGFLGWFVGSGYDHRLDVHLHLWPFCLVLVPFLGAGDGDARAKPWGSLFSFSLSQ